MKVKLVFFVFCLMVKEYLFAAPNFVKSYCAVDAPVYCVRPSNASSIISGNLTWTPKFNSSRETLRKSFDVQNDARGCAAFAQLLKTECALQYPVVAVFSAGAGQPQVVSYAIGFDRKMACNPNLSPAFIRYFQENTNPSPTPPPIDSCDVSSSQVPVFSFIPSSITLMKNVTMRPIFPVLSNQGPITSCSITPALPIGLIIDQACMISGKPTGVVASTLYTVKASNSLGSSTATVTIQVKDGVAPSLAYSTPVVLNRFTESKINPSSSSGGFENCTVSPALPNGLMLSLSTCSIYGTSTNTSNATSYTVTASNAYGSKSVVVNIKVQDIAPKISYPTSVKYVFYKSVAVTRYAYSIGGGITSCTATPALPAGLTLGATNCNITGTPTVASAKTTYTIKATNSFGSSSTSLVLGVYDSIPAFNFAASTYSFKVGSVISAVVPTSTGGYLTSCSSNPFLPAGIILNQETCAISGTPLEVTAAANYTIVGYNSAGSSSKVISITVNEGVPKIQYPQSSFTFATKYMINEIPALSTGGTITSCTSTPALPSGMSFRTTTTCSLQGTPQSPQAATSYTIKASNSAGSYSVVISIAVQNSAPNFKFNSSKIKMFYNDGANIQATNVGSPITSCTVSPALPSYLTLNSNCTFGGIPTGLLSDTVYTFTGVNSFGTSTAKITLSVTDRSPIIYYKSSPVVLTKGIANSISASIVGGSIGNCTISPNLPTGLVINSKTCTISGTPTVSSADKAYTVSASNSYGMSLTGLNLQVK